jgi:hypothetical protein
MFFRIKRSRHLLCIQTMYPGHYSKGPNPFVLHIFSFGTNWLLLYEVFRGGGCVVPLLTLFSIFCDLACLQISQVRLT